MNSYLNMLLKFQKQMVRFQKNMKKRKKWSFFQNFSSSFCCGFDLTQIGNENLRQNDFKLLKLALINSQKRFFTFDQISLP